MTYVIRVQVVEVETGSVILEIDSVKSQSEPANAVTIAQKAIAVIQKAGYK